MPMKATDIALTVRVAKVLHEELGKAAVAADRTLAQEIRRRLRASMAEEQRVEGHAS